MHFMQHARHSRWWGVPHLCIHRIAKQCFENEEDSYNLWHQVHVRTRTTPACHCAWVTMCSLSVQAYTNLSLLEAPDCHAQLQLLNAVCCLRCST